MAGRAVVFDFYGTLAEIASDGPSWDDVLGDLGYTLLPEARNRWFNDGLDGVEHDEHSRSRDHYVAWQHARTRALLDESGIPPAVQAEAIARVDAMWNARRLAAYDEVASVLASLRGRGYTLAICSNWDWDLHEAVDAAGLTGTFDVVVSSAWVGARKPHRRIYTHVLDQLGVAAAQTVFVGDTWACDVEGPAAMGMMPVYVRRSHFGADKTAPDDHHERRGVHRARDLRALLDLVEAG